VRSDELSVPLRRVQEGYTKGVRSLALRAMRRVASTRVTPNTLTAAGVSLCVAAAVLVGFESRDKLLFYWLAAGVFLLGSVLDILDGALARAGGKSTPFGAFIDSSTDRVGEGALLLTISLVFAHSREYLALAFAVAAVGGSFLVPYVRAKAEAIGLRADVGIGGRAERVFVLVAALAFAPWGALPWAIGFLAVTAWVTVVQRILHARKQLLGGTNGIGER
jgi:CDP-diacylglycerol--glycerol-3-phosphate 3-phosphatidyltransferase